MRFLYGPLRRHVLTMPWTAAALGIGTFQAWAGTPAPSNYVLGPGDLVSIHVLQAPDLLDKPVRVDLNGSVDLPHVGQVHAGGATIDSLKSEVESKLADIIRDPQVSISIEALRGQSLGATRAASSYVLGADDLLSIRVLQAPELVDKPVRIDLNGSIELPYIGHLRAAGSTIEQLTAELEAKFTSIVREPQVTISVEEFRSQPVSLLGAVNTPGVHQIRGKKTLVEVLSLGGGLRQDVGNSIKITRHIEWGLIPLPSAIVDSTKQYSIATIDLRVLMEAKDPAVNILVLPDDVISIPRAEMVYVAGEVTRTGGFVLSERESMSLLEALSLAGGLSHEAAPQSARILRMKGGSTDRTEIPVNVKKILTGQAQDIQLLPEDIFFIPGSAAKRASLRAVEAAIQIGTGIVVWRH
jgi:polysaccharide export outer membrane protein